MRKYYFHCKVIYGVEQKSQILLVTIFRIISYRYIILINDATLLPRRATHASLRAAREGGLGASMKDVFEFIFLLAGVALTFSNVLLTKRSN